MAGLQWQPGKEGVDQIVNLLTAYMSPAQDQVRSPSGAMHVHAATTCMHAIDRAEAEGRFQASRGLSNVAWASLGGLGTAEGRGSIPSAPAGCRGPYPTAHHHCDDGIQRGVRPGGLDSATSEPGEADAPLLHTHAHTMHDP